MATIVFGALFTDDYFGEDTMFVVLEAFGLLVPLGSTVTGVTPTAYRRRRLRRPSKEASSRGGLRT